ncbi:MAG TPA: acetyltransferase [Vicinamibacterales bacterium]|nr:acetyltransferase [Vicinamibacterales bacterium]
MRVLVIGCGGHGQVVADILLRMNELSAPVTVVGFLDDDAAQTGRRYLDLQVLGKVSDRRAVEHDAVVIAVGDNRVRQRLAAEFTSDGERFATARHPSAVIAPDVSIAPGTMICAGVVVNTGSVIGAHAILNTACSVDHHNRIGDCALIGPGVHMGGDVRIGTGVLIGIGSIVMPQRQVGEWTVVGAGSVVTSDLPSGVTALGTPARVR